MSEAISTRYQALPLTKRLEFQEYMKPIRRALLYRFQYKTIPLEQYLQEYDAASNAALNLVEEPAIDELEQA